MMASWLLVCVTTLLCGCGKKEAPAQAKAEAVIVAPPTLLTEAARLGLARRIAGDVEFCVSSVGLRKHLEALLQSNWWSQTAAYLEEQAPAGDAAAEPLVIDEAFIAFGKDSSRGIAMLRQLNDLYNETAYRGMVSGAVSDGPAMALDAAKVVEVVLRDAQLLEAVILWLERFEMPPAMIGVASPNPEKVLHRLSNLLRLPDWLGDVPQSRIVTTQGEQLTVSEIAMDQILTADRRRHWLEAMGKALPQITPEMRDRVARGLEVLARKNWVLALGLGPQRAFLAVAESKSQIRLANSVADSILVRQEMRSLDVNATRDLGGIACWSGAFLDALQSAEPFQPMVRGLLAGIQNDKRFAGIAQTLGPLAVELAAAERAFYGTPFTNGAAVAWWADGLHAEWTGGAGEARVKAWSMPGRLSRLLDDKEVILGMSGHDTPSVAGRAYFEAWMRTAHAVARELVHAGAGGEKSAELFKLMEQSLLPAVLKIYDGTKTIWEKALGEEGAFVLDAGGKMPALPGLPPGGQEVPLPRVLLVNELRNRELIGAAWHNIESGMRDALALIPAPEPLQMPEPKAVRSRDMETFVYQLPTGSKDLLPSVSLTQSLFMAGTSQYQQTQAADRLRHPDSKAMIGARMKLDFAKLREFLMSFASVRSDADGLKQAAKALAPLGALEIRMWGDRGEGRGGLAWRIHDVPRYD